MTSPQLDRSAAMALGIAATAMPFAGSQSEEAERWLRILRSHGESSLILSSVGVTEAASEAVRDGEGENGNAGQPSDHDAVARITEEAGRLAAARGAELVSTGDVLEAVIHVYGEAFDRVLRAHGTSGEEVHQLLELQSGSGSGEDVEG